MQKKYESQGVVFLAINVDRKQKDAEKFLKETPAQFIVAFDPKGKTPKAFDVMGMPTAFLIGRDGKIARVWDKVKVKDHAAEVLAAVAEL